jgi:hypothetical protein
VGVAVNVTDVPVQIVLAVAAIETAGTAGELTITFVLAAAEGPLQPEAVTLITAVPVYVALHVTVPVVLVPAIVPAVAGEIVQLYAVALVAEVV